MAAVRRLLLPLLLLLLLSKLSFSIPESEALLMLKKSLNNTDALKNWVSGSSPCVKRWVGIICTDGVLTGLHLSDLGLSGTIDITALQEIRMLRTISLVNNSFSGPIPEFNKLGALKSLLLSRNQFSGEIADDFFSTMLSLKKVWLSNNNFTGKIPASVMQLNYLTELHLEGNEFSGMIPPLKQPKILNSLDVSHNKLEGQIPESFSKFSASTFDDNPKLCGKPLDKDCSQMESSDEDESESEETEHVESSNTIARYIAYVLIGAIVLFIVISVCVPKKSDYEENFSMLEKEGFNAMAPAAGMPSSSKVSIEPSKKGSDLTKRGSSRGSLGASHHSRQGVGDLVMINSEKGAFGLPDLMKAAAEVLGNGGLGSAYKAAMANGLVVVVKRIREMNALGRDRFDAEMRQFGRIRNTNILTPLAYHFRKEEKLLVSEYVPKGSLLYVLHGDRGICHAGLNWPTRLKIIRGIASGLKFLHSEYSTYNLPHGNLKSSNVLLGQEYEPLLTDYALDPLTNPNHAQQAMFAYKSPEFIQNNEVSHKSDIYCLGIIILEVMTGKFPSQYLSNGKGGTDVVQWVLQASYEQREHEVIDPVIARDANSLDQMVQMLLIGVACADSNPAQRLDMREAIRRIEQIQA